MKLTWMVCVLAAAGACKGKDKDSGAAATGSGSAAPTGSGTDSGSGSATPTDGRGSADGSGSAATTGSGSGSGSAVVARVANWTDMRTIKVEGPTPKELAMAEEVLPAGEALPLARVVIGDGFRYQLPNIVSAVTIDGSPGFGGIDDVTIPATPQFHWATVATQSGDTASAVARQKGIVEASGGTISGEMRAPVWIAGKLVPDGAVRFTATFDDRTERLALVAHGGKHYVLHCAAPTVEKAWVHSAEPCEHFAKSFHVAAPPPKKK